MAMNNKIWNMLNDKYTITPSLDGETYVMGYWEVKNNTKYPATDKHYEGLLKATIEPLENKNIVFYYSEDKCLDWFKESVRTDSYKTVKVSIEDLPTWEISEEYMNIDLDSSKKMIHAERGAELRRTRCAEHPRGIIYSGDKGLAHIKRECKDFEAYRKMFTIWTSKVLLIEQVIKENPFNSDYFSWMDVTFSRTRWLNFINHDYDPNHLFHYGNNMGYMGPKVGILAAFFLAHKNTWSKVIESYKKQLKISSTSNYPHDEETLLHLVMKDNMEMFKELIKPMFGCHDWDNCEWWSSLNVKEARL